MSLSQSRRAGSLGRGLALTFLLGALFVLAVTQTARGQDLDGRQFSVRGFGTLAATTQDADGLEFRRNVGQSKGVAAGDVEFATDSLAGVQFDAKLGSHFDVLVQGVTRARADGDWAPELTQAFVRYSPDESLVLRVGRFGYEIYLLAESRQVGYSYLTVRPSADFYGMVTNDDIDGADISLKLRLGSGLVRARLFGGRGSDKTVFADGSIFGGHSKVYGGTFDYLYRGFTARAAYLQATYDEELELQQLADVLTGSGVPASIAIGEELRGAQTSTGIQLGVAYDDGPLQAQLLYGHILTESIAGPNIDAWYVQAGYRLRAWTPFVAAARSHDLRDIRSTGLPDIPELAPINGAVFGIQKNLRATQHTATVGVRWDLSPRIDLKLQVDFTSVHDSSYNFDRRAVPSGDANMTVAALAVDFVF
ncbi:MAG: porin [Pseudomonadota bacterium]